jgi:hypothetical protein
MKKVALMVLVAAFAASPAVAAKKKSKKMHAAPAAQTDLNANGKRLVMDSLPLALPGWAIPIYLHAHQKDGGKKK